MEGTKNLFLPVFTKNSIDKYLKYQYDDLNVLIILNLNLIRKVNLFLSIHFGISTIVSVTILAIPMYTEHVISRLSFLI